MVTKKTRTKIEELYTYLNSSRTIKSSEVVDTYNTFLDETGSNERKAHGTGCTSCLIRYIKIMHDYMARETPKEETKETPKPKKTVKKAKTKPTKKKANKKTKKEEDFSFDDIQL